MAIFLNQTIVYLFSFFFKQKQIKIQEQMAASLPYVSLKDKYINRMNSRFLSCLANTYNENITNLEYIRYPSLGCGCTSSCFIKSWERRILIENVGDCNVFMKYDIERRAFVYYCDNRSLSYDVLNAVAMKFVLTYRCRDYFLDNTVKGYKNESPFLTYAITMGKPDVKKKEDSKFNDLSIDSPFVKVKTGIKDDATKTECDTVMNRFIYLGKFYNFSMLQPIEKKKPKEMLSFANYKSKMYDHIFH